VIEEERSLESLLRLVRLAQTVAVEDRDLVPQSHPGRVRFRLGLPLQHPREFVPLALDRIETLERIPVLVLRVELAKRILCAPVVGLGIQQRLPRGHSQVELLQLLGVHRGQLGEDDAPFDRIVGKSRLLFQNRRQLLPPLLTLVQLLQLCQRLRVAVVDLENFAPQLDRYGCFLELLSGQLGDLGPAPPPLGRIGHAPDLLPQHRHQSIPVPPLLVHLLEEGQRLGVPPINLENRLERLDGLGLVGELFQVQVRHPQVQCDLRRGRADDGRLLAQHRNQLRPAWDDLVLGRQRIHHLDVAGLKGQDPVVGLDHHDIEFEPIAVQLDHLQEDRDLRLGSGPSRLFNRLFQDLDAGLPAFRPPVDPGQLAPGRPGRGSGRHDLLPRIDALLHRQTFGLQRRCCLALQLRWKVRKHSVRGRFLAHLVLRDE